MVLTAETVKVLKDVMAESREILVASYEVSHLLLDARRHCHAYCYRAAELSLVEATAKHQMLTNRVTRMLRKADAAVTELAAFLETGPDQSH